MGFHFKWYANPQISQPLKNFLLYFVTISTSICCDMHFNDYYSRSNNMILKDMIPGLYWCSRSTWISISLVLLPRPFTDEPKHCTTTTIELNLLENKRKIGRTPLFGKRSYQKQCPNLCYAPKPSHSYQNLTFYRYSKQRGP